jgi:hypothetical protein
MNDQFVYLKLVTGEQLMAYKEYEDGASLIVRFPMLIKTHLIAANNDRISEQVTAGPYSLFIDAPNVRLNKSHIVLDSKLHDRAIAHYVQLVHSHEGVSLEYEGKMAVFQEEQLEDFEAIPDVSNAIEQLREIAGELEQEAELAEEGTYIEGNKTLH